MTVDAPLVAMPAHQDPMFDSTRKALVFALNATEAFITSPTMNTMMSAGPSEHKATTDAPSATNPPQPGHRLRGLDKAAQAGFILRQLERLDVAHQNMLKARLIQAKQPCACGNPCCRGYRLHYHWSKAMYELSDYLRLEADLVPTKKGMSTHPNLRDAVLRRYFSFGHIKSNNRLGEELELSHVTVAKHATLIETCLDKLETEAWCQIQAIFDQHGVTGFVE